MTGILRTILILAFLHFNSCNAPSQSVLQKVRSLDLGSIEGNITTYYSDSHKDRAETVHNLLLGSVNFFETSFQVDRTFSIAVLDRADWGRITDIPYGMPFVSGPPYIVGLPYLEKGSEFLDKMKAHQWPSASAPVYLDEMEDLAPGFVSWSKYYNMAE
jgi:hypothetical protein